MVALNGPAVSRPWPSGQTSANPVKARLAPAVGYPVDTSPALNRLIREYERGVALQVSFRELVPWIRVGERGTHYLHSYPAKLLPQIAHFFLAATSLAHPGAVVLDPFAGTGTVALEALISGRQSFYADANPLARMITSTKTRLIPTLDLVAAFERIELRYKRYRTRETPDVVNLVYWYDPSAIRSLCRLKAAIEAEERQDVRELFLVTFSSAARRSSRADPRFSVPVRRKLFDSPTTVEGTNVLKDAWQLFADQFRANLRRQEALRMLSPEMAAVKCVGRDARSLRLPASWDLESASSLPDGEVDIVITSPPYASAQKYVRASSLSLGWLGLASHADLKKLERASIGREHLNQGEVASRPDTGIFAADQFVQKIALVNPKRAAILATYLAEMQCALKEAVRVLKPSGHMILIVGDNHACGEPFTSAEYLTEMLSRLGMMLKLKVADSIISRGLITKRHSTAAIIAQEWVLLFQKTGFRR